MCGLLVLFRETNEREIFKKLRTSSCIQIFFICIKIFHKGIFGFFDGVTFFFIDLHFLRVICLICFVFSRGSSAVDPETGYIVFGTGS